MSTSSEQATTATSVRRSSNAGSYAGLASTAPGSTPSLSHYPSGLPKESQAGLEVIKEELRHTTTMIKNKSKQLYQKGESSNLVQYVKSKLPTSINLEISEKRNYLLESALAVQKLVKPAYEAYGKLSATEQSLILVLSVILLWLPALLALFTVAPMVVFGYVAFYLYFFNAGVLKKHMNGVLVELSGYNYEQLYVKGIEFSKVIANETLYYVYHFTSGNSASQLKQSSQRAMAMFTSLVVLSLGALITLLARIQSFVVGVAPAPPSSSTAASGKTQ